MVKLKKKKDGKGHYTFTDLMVDCRYFVSRDNISGFFQIQNVNVLKNIRQVAIDKNIEQLVTWARKRGFFFGGGCDETDHFS